MEQMYTTYSLFFLFLALLFVSPTQVSCWWLNLGTTLAPTAFREDEKFTDTNFPAQDWNSTSYSKSEWDELIAENVNLSDFNKIRQHVIWRMEDAGIVLDEENRFKIIEETEKYYYISPWNIERLMDSILLLYTMGAPLHTGKMFYRDFNRDTKAAIEKKISFSQYNYSVEYALIDRAHKERAYKLGIGLYRGVSLNPDPLYTFNIDEKFRFNHFSSVTEKRAVALKFSGPGGTLIYAVNAKVLPMWETSQYSSEREYLVSPFQEFKIYSVTRYDDYNITKVEMVAPWFE